MDFEAVSPLCAASLVGCHADIVPTVRGGEGSYDQQGAILQQREPRLSPAQLPPIPQPFHRRLGNTCKEKGKRPQMLHSAHNQIDSKFLLLAGSLAGRTTHKRKPQLLQDDFNIKNLHPKCCKILVG